MSWCEDTLETIEAESCCTPEDSAHDAAVAMKTSGRACSPVVEDMLSLKLVGVITAQNISRHVAAENLRASDVRVKDIMEPIWACCKTNESMEAAGQKMRDHRALSLPVMSRAGSCCGTVSSQDLCFETEVSAVSV